MKPLDRRTLLRGAGGAAVALPFLEAMARGTDEPAPPRRFVVFFTPEGYGSDRSKWEPVGTGTSFTLSPILAPLERHKSKLLVLSGIDLKASYTGAQDNGHPESMATLLTGIGMQPDGPDTYGDIGAGGGPSIDHVMAETLGPKTPFRALHLGVQKRDFNQFSTLTYQGPRKPVPTEDNPGAAFNRLFRVDAGRIRAHRQTVIDAVLESVRDLVPKLGGEDRRRLDSHVTALHEIERRLALTPVSAECRAPVLDGAPADHQAPANFPAVGKLQMDILAMALACDLTRVATLIWSYTGSEVVHSWIGLRDPHHTLSHARGTAAAQTAVQVWYEQQFAYFLDRLASIPEGATPLLDNLVILRTRELSEAPRHTRHNTPLLLAGGCQGHFKTGRHLKFDAAPNNDLLVSLMNAMGLEVTTFGDPKLCNGPLPGLTT